MTLHVDIVSAEEAIYSGKATMVFAPAEMGEVGIAPRHTPMMTRLKPGVVRVQLDDKEELVVISGGLLEVQPHMVTVLADTAIRGDDLDEAAALAAKEHAEHAMRDNTSKIEYAKAKAELAIAVAELQALRKLRGNK